MTADISDEDVTESDQVKGIELNRVEGADSTNGELPREIVEIFEFLSCNDKIVFKSQQIDDPELERIEKIQIAREIYDKNRQTFLMRFGNYFEERHLESFTQTLASNAPMKSDEHYDEMQLLLVSLERKLQTRKQDVKNRRYAAMQELIAQGDYFSEQEMMKRAPELYQELVGQYLSENEKKQRDSYDVKNTSFSGILLHTMEQKEMDDVLKQADKQNKLKLHTRDMSNNDDEGYDQNSFLNNLDEDSSSCSSTTRTRGEQLKDESAHYEVPANFRQQWGNFDNEQVSCSTSRSTGSKYRKDDKHKVDSISRNKNVKTNDTFITAGERNLLRQEFIGLMHEQFLAGNDTDFDYSQVDDNSQLDDLQQLNQDKEDAYFEGSDEEEDNDVIEHHTDGIRERNHLLRYQNIRDSGEHDLNESEDELDIYMSHLNKHFTINK